MTANHRQTLEDRLRAEYGEVMTPRDLVRVLRYPTEGAVLKAHSRGTLPVRLGRFPRRRGWYATVESVARCLDDLREQQK